MTRLAIALCVTIFSGCYEYRHYREDAAEMDYVFFGAVDDQELADAPQAAGRLHAWDGDQWFFVWGLFPHDDKTTTYAADQIVDFRSKNNEAYELTIVTSKSFWNVTAEAALNAIPVVNLLVPFIFNWRAVEVRAAPLRETPSS